MIIWLNGGFGAGKTTLAEELHRRLPDALVYNPEDVGIMLWKWMPYARMPEPGGDWDQFARQVGMTGVAEIAAAAARQPVGTLMLRSDRSTPAELADQVLAVMGVA